MEYVIDTSQPMQLNFGAIGAERILQNVINLINTFLYEVAYNRTMGINPEIFDKPVDVAAALYAAEVYRVVSDYEPRAKVKKVNLLSVDDEGLMQFKVVIEI